MEPLGYLVYLEPLARPRLQCSEILSPGDRGMVDMEYCGLLGWTLEKAPVAGCRGEKEG